MLPAKLKQYRVFGDGTPYLGLTKQIELPKLAMKGEAYRGDGMLAELDADLGLEKLTMTVTYGGLMVPVLRQFGITRADGVMLRFVGAYQSDSTGSATAAELVVRGRHTELDPGNAEAGADTEWKVQSTLAYLKWTVGGSVEVEIDVLGCVYRMGGIDRMAEIRAILGG